jgi:hypothetical protein
MFRHISFVSTFFNALLLLPVISSASEVVSVYKISEIDSKAYLEICTSASCIKKNLPIMESKKYYLESPVFELNDIDGDGVPELVATDKNINGAVNVRSVIFRINKSDEFEYIKKNSNGIYVYNVNFYKGKIVSSFRDAASWYTEVYNYANGKLEIESRDKDGLERTVFDKNGKEFDTFLLKEDSSKKWFEKEILTARVKSQKAALYNSPKIEDISKMYLIKNDTVVLKYFHLAENKTDVEFYLIEYITAKNKKIIKWIKQEALSIGN